MNRFKDFLNGPGEVLMNTLLTTMRYLYIKSSTREDQLLMEILIKDICQHYSNAMFEVGRISCPTIKHEDIVHEIEQRFRAKINTISTNGVYNT